MEIAIPAVALTSHGGGRVIVELANSLAEKGCKVRIITTRYSGTMPFAFNDQIKIIRIGPRTSSKALCLLIFLLACPYYLRRTNILATYFLTVIPSWIATTAFGSNYLYFVQAIETQFFTRAWQSPLRWICEWTYRRGRIISANSYLTKRLDEQHAVVSTINIGISDIFFTYPPTSQPKKFDLIYFMRAQPAKRLDRFDAMLPLFAAQGLLVLCISQDYELLGRYASHPNIKVVVPANDIEIIQAIDQARILLLTSDNEGFALPPLEGMSRGLPSVMFECGGPSVYAVDSVNCIIQYDDNATELANRTVALIENPTALGEMSIHAKTTASKFRMSEAIRAFEEIVEREFSDAN